MHVAVLTIDPVVELLVIQTFNPTISQPLAYTQLLPLIH